MRGEGGLMSAFVDGDARTFEVFYERYAPAVTRFAWSVSPNVVQEIFLTAWRRARLIHTRRLGGTVAADDVPQPRAQPARKERQWRDLLELREESIAADASEGVAADVDGKSYQFVYAADGKTRLGKLYVGPTARNGSVPIFEQVFDFDKVLR